MRVHIVLFLVGLAVSFVSCEFTLEKYKQMHDTCVAQSGCDEATIERARQGNFEPKPEFKSFLKCCFEQEEALRPDGTIDVEKVINSFHDVLIEKYAQPIRDCANEVSHGGDTLDYVYNYCYCIYEKTLETFDIP